MPYCKTKRLVLVRGKDNRKRIAMPPMDDSSSGVETFDPLSSDVVNHEGEWEYREDNRIT